MASVRDVWMAIAVSFAFAAVAALQSALPADEAPGTSVLTRSYDNGRTGANLTETHFRFLSAHDQINNLFHLRRDYVTAAEHRASRAQQLKIWAEICSVGSQ
jgi:hypothetical protein